MTGRRAAVSVVFLFFGMNGGSVLPRIPAIKESLHLTDGQVGAAFFAFAVGAVLAAAAARLVIGRGARRPVRIALFVLCATLVTPGLAPSFASLAAAFFVLGAGSGFLDMLLNAQAAEIERDERRPMINGFHAYWSVGSIAGSLIAAGAAAAHVSPAIHFTVVAVVLALASIPLAASVPDTHGGAVGLVASDSARWRIGAAVAIVALLAFLALVVEGAGQDWSAIFVRDIGHASQEVAAIAFAALSIAMTVVRFAADRLTAATSARVVAAIGGLVSALGFVIAVAFPVPPIAIAGFALVGAGCAVLFPLAMSASANLDDAGTALSVATSSGYAASIVGPPVIGAAADHFGLRPALLIPALAGLAVLGMMASSRVLSKRAPRRLDDAPERVESEA